MKFKSFSAVFCATFMVPLSAFAQPPAKEGWRIGVGAGALLAPNYEGDNNYRLSILPNIQVEYADRFFASVQNGIGYNLINSEQLRIGPIGKIQFSRNESGSQPFAVTGERTSDLIGLGDVDTTFELGAFAEYEAGPFTARIEARQGVNGHDGFVAETGVSYGKQTFVLGPPLIYSFGPRVKFVGENYDSAYFGVTADQSAASGLPVYEAEGGLYSYGVGGALILPITRDGSASAVMFAGYERLTGDAPLVIERGSRDQLSIGIVFSYWLW